MERESERETLDIGGLMDGARLLVMGGTGFLGKVFWVMLLDRYPQIGKLYLLVRGGKAGGQTSDERFWSSVATSDCLEPLRQRYPGPAFEAFLREKVVPVSGDVSLPECGIDVTDLRGTIDAVVNVAGVVDFNPPLDEALDANAFGAQNLVALARALGDVPLMHTSTCYVAGRRKGPILEVDPREHPFPRAGELGRDLWDPAREIAECLDLIAQAKHRCDDAFRQSELEEKAKKNLASRGEPTEGQPLASELKKVRRKFVSERLVEAGLDRATHWGWPNIYTYTKSIGEQVIARSGLPFTIVRPACCETTMEFPFQGWNEGISTSAPLIYLIMKGQVQIPLEPITLDFIPTDYVVSGMILALAELLEGSQKPVYQFGSSDSNPCSASRFGELTGLYKRKHYQKKGTGNPFVNIFQAHMEPIAVSVERFDAIGSPALANVGRELAGVLKKTAPFLRPAAQALEGMAKREEKIGMIARLFAPFTTEANGPFDCSNTRAAHARLNDEERAKLPWAPESLDWAHWFHKVHMPAMEKWILPEMDKKLAREVTPLQSHATLLSLLDQMAERHDRALLLQRLEADGFSRVTYREVHARAFATAARLAALGIGKGDRVVLSGKNHPDWAVAYFGILRAGATAVPIDPTLDDAARAVIVKDSGAKLIVADVAPPPNGVASLDLHEATREDASLVAPRVDVTPDDVASLIYTSGTTGTPKGVKLTHANFTSLIAALAPIFPLKAGDRVMSVLPLHHTFEFTCGLLLPLSRGARIAYLDELNGDRLAEGLKLGRVSAMVGVPALWQMLERRILTQVHARGPLAEAAFNWGGELNRMLGKTLGVDAGRFLFGSVHEALGGQVKYLISGGAALPRETQKLFAGIGLPLTEGYGLTEAAPVLTVAKASPRSSHGQVGKPIPGVKVAIANADADGVGEVIAKGPNVMAGYTDDAATARAIDGDGWLHTGDLGKLDKQGRLSVVGRIKDVVVSSTGENVYPEDVERRLGSIGGVTELAVCGVDGPSGERLACLAVPAAREGDDDEPRSERNARVMKSLRGAIDKLPYAQRPAVVHLSDAALPRTATRKVKREEVRAILQRKVAATLRPPSGDVSAVKVAIAALKGLDVASLPAEATLAGDLGFDSLMLTELLEALEAKGAAIAPAALQACRTVADVEALAGSAIEPARAPIDKGDAREQVVIPPELQEAGKKLIGKLQDAFYGQVMKPTVTGRAFIPHNRRTMVVANHSSHLDMGLVRHALGSYGEDIVSLAAQDFFFEGGLRRAFFENLTNLKAIDRSSFRASVRQAGEVLDQGKTVLIFPEGTRSKTGEIGEWKPLIGHLALTHGVDILPVFLGGTHAAMPKGMAVPTRRDVRAKIGPPLCIADLRRLTEGMAAADAAREVTRLARAAVVALAAGEVLDLQRAKRDEPVAPEKEHPLVTLFAELEEKFKPAQVEKPVSYYFTLGSDELAKWTVRVDAERCEVKPGKPEGGTADCVLKTTSEIFTKIVRESYVPGPADFMSGAIKSNDVSLLVTFQKVFQLES
jgi:long-chain acyl-CoA synthetase